MHWRILARRFGGGKTDLAEQDATRHCFSILRALGLCLIEDGLPPCLQGPLRFQQADAGLQIRWGWMALAPGPADAGAEAACSADQAARGATPVRGGAGHRTDPQTGSRNRV